MIRRFAQWVAYRFEVYRFGFGPMYPLYVEAIRRKADLDAKLARGDDPGLISLEELERRVWPSGSTEV